MKNLLFISILTVCTNTLYAQTGLYLRAGVGYAIPNAGQTVSSDGTPFNGSINNLAHTSTPVTYDVKKASFAAGFNGALGIGYMFTSHLGVEFGFSAVLAPREFAADDSNVVNPAGADYYDIVHIKRHATLPFFLTPSLVYVTGGKKLSGYARGGIVLPLSMKLEEQYTYVDQYGMSEDMKLETTCKFGAGFSGAMGVSYKFDKNISVWLEANVLSLSAYAKESKVTEHTSNGITTTITPPAGTTIKYSNNGSYNYIGSTTTVSTNRPTYSIPFSNVGLSIGISVALQKQKEEKTSARR
jgi:hypothetical protein